MANLSFTKASKKQSRLRMAVMGPAGSGKTYTALSVATGLGNRIAVIDTERGSASKYADKFDFEVLELDTFDPQLLIDAIGAASEAGFDVLVIDSLSHFWSGKDGALEKVDNAARRSSSGNSYAAWRNVTPLHNRMVDAILQAPMHVMVTMRTKTEHVLDEVNGKKVPRKVGTAPIQRDGMEYEFDVVGDVDIDHVLTISKTRCDAITDKAFPRAGAELAAILKAWLTDGAPIPVVVQSNGASFLVNESGLRAEFAALAEGREDAVCSLFKVDDIRDINIKHIIKIMGNKAGERDAMLAKLAEVEAQPVEEVANV